MKLKKRLMIVLGGTVFAAVMIHAIAAFIGISSHSKYICGTVADFHESTSKEKNQEIVTGDSIYLENRFNFYFMVLEYFLSTDDLLPAGEKFFKESSSRELDNLIVAPRRRTGNVSSPDPSCIRRETAGDFCCSKCPRRSVGKHL